MDQGYVTVSDENIPDRRLGISAADIARLLASLPQVPQTISGAQTDAEIVDLWLSRCRSPHTLRLYERAAARLLSHLPHGLTQATVSDIERFEASLAPMKATSRHTFMNAIRSLFHFAERTGHVFRSPAHISRRKRPSQDMRQRLLSEDEIRALISATPSERDRQVLRMLYGTGIRISELCSLIWGRVRIAQNGVVIATVLGKGDVYRDIPVPDYVGLSRPEAALDEDAVFTADPTLHPWPPISANTVRRSLHLAALRAGLRKNVSPHWLRHSAATHLQERGVPAMAVQKLLGHASLGTTTGYSHAMLATPPGNVLLKD